MKLQWLGHSSFLSQESTGTTVITDPFSAASVGYAMAYLNADIITSSHGHPQHNYYGGVKGSPSIINRMGSQDIKGVGITSIMSEHDAQEGATRGSNLIFKFRIDGIDVVHLGDIGCACTPELVEQIAPVDILLIPVGGNEYTIDIETCIDYINKLMPSVTIPMHYKTEHCDSDILKLDTFLKEFEDETIEYLNTHTIFFSREDFDQGGQKVIIPKRFKG